MQKISKLRPDGNSLVVTVPKEWIDFYSLKEGDHIEWKILNMKSAEVKNV